MWLVHAAVAVVLTGCASNEGIVQNASESPTATTTTTTTPEPVPQPRYVQMAMLGSGGGGEVALVSRKTIDGEDEILAMKCGIPSRSQEYLSEFAFARVFSLCRNSFPKVFDFFADEDGRPCIVMERLGTDLRRIREAMTEPIPVPTVLAIGLHMLETLTAIHRAGWAHGDAHPENWLGAPDTDPSDPLDPTSLKLIDFGWATVLTPAQKRHDLRTIALTMRFAVTGEWLFEFPFGCPYREEGDIPPAVLCGDVPAELCRVITDIYSLPETAEIETHYGIVKALLE